MGLVTPFSGTVTRYGLCPYSAGVDQIVRHVGSLDTPSYTFFDLPDLVSACHEYGIDGAEVHYVLNLIEREFSRLASARASGYRLVISSDHGHLNLNFEKSPGTLRW